MVAPLAYPVRMPTWLLYYAGRNVTANISAMVIEFTYNDKAEEDSDDLEVTLADRDKQWQGPWFPTRGDTVTAQIGYVNERMLNCGSFQVDELELKGPPDTFHLKCLAAGITPSIRTPRSAGYEASTLLDIATVIAGRHGLTLVGAPENIDITFDRKTQRKETDLQFLHRLATDHNYDFSIRGMQLIFYARTALEKKPAVATVLRTQTKSFEFLTKSHQIYQSASSAYQNPDQKQLIATSATNPTAPTGDNLHGIYRLGTPEEATLRANAALHQKDKDEVTSRLETTGTVLLVAGVNITIQGFGKYDGLWHIESSKHQLERISGYTTEIEARRL